MLSFTEVLDRFGPWKKVGQEYRVLCPVHGDSSPSLDIREGQTGPLFACRSHHCDTADILAAKGLTWGDVLPSRNGHREEWDHVYDYTTRDGTLLYRVHRRDAHGSEKKRIAQRAANGDWSIKGIPTVPYRLAHLSQPVVIVVEGEKATDAIWAAGYEATTNSGGAGNWRDSDTQALKDAGIDTLIVLPDNDEPGFAHAARIEASAAKHGLSARRAILPDLPPGGDAADWLQHHTPDEFFQAIKTPPPALLLNLDDAVDVAAEGQQIATDGIKYLVDGIIPDYAPYGGVGFLIGQAKVGKSSLVNALAAAIATGQPFLDRDTAQRRVLVIAAEDPPPYVAWMSRHLDVPPGAMTFSRAPLQLNAEGLSLIVNTIHHGEYGLVLIASWQAVVLSLVKDENDNAGSVAVVEAVKRAARDTHAMWLIDAHAGKGENQRDDADPTLAMRGASAAAGAADFLLSYRYADSPFSTKRRLSGKGRFVNLETLLVDYDPHTGLYTPLSGTSQMAETTWALIDQMGALDETWCGVSVIAARAGLCATPHDANGHIRRKVHDALFSRPKGIVDRQEITQKKRQVWQFRRASSE